MWCGAVTAILSALLSVGPAAIADIEYASTISPIVTKNCAVCHYRDGTAPFPLLRYEEVVGRKAMVREVVANRRMPPWDADTDFGRFKNDRRLTDEEINAITAWIDNGAPRGRITQPVELQRFPSQWSMGKPDAEFILPESADIPATGLAPIRTFEVRSGFPRDTWITAVEIRPGNPKVVHHITVALKQANDPVIANSIATNSGFIGRYASGTTAMVFPEGQALLIPKNATFVVRVHYMTCGKIEKDRSRFGFLIADQPPANTISWAELDATDFTIPARASNHAVETSGMVSTDMLLHALNIDMHYRGRAIEVVLHYPSGRSASLLRIPQFDFDWLTDYVLEKPIFLPRGTRIEMTGVFDNSADNPANPDPGIAVKPGTEATDESLRTRLLVSPVPNRAHIAPGSVANADELAAAN